MPPFGPATLGSNDFHCIKFSIAFSGNGIPTAILGFQKRVIPELLKDAGASVTNLVLTILVTDMSSGPSQVGE